MHRAVQVGLLFIFLSMPRAGLPSGHGPVFGLATPTNARGGWALDFGIMSRIGSQNNGLMSRAMLSYGVTEDLQFSVTAPYVFSSAALSPSRATSMMSATPDFEGITAWRFHRQGTDVGTRFESTIYAGSIIPGIQRPQGMLGALKKAPGFYTAAVTGMASRTHYLWAGIGNAHFVERDGDQRPNLFTYSFVWGYRPPALRKDYPHWDWRFFVETTGEISNKVRHLGQRMSGTGGHQLFVGPTVLGIYKNYAIEGGLQLPAFRDIGSNFQRERIRWTINFSRFF